MSRVRERARATGGMLTSEVLLRWGRGGVLVACYPPSPCRSAVDLSSMPGSSPSQPANCIIGLTPGCPYNFEAGQHMRRAGGFSKVKRPAMVKHLIQCQQHPAEISTP